MQAMQHPQLSDLKKLQPEDPMVTQVTLKVLLPLIVDLVVTLEEEVVSRPVKMVKSLEGRVGILPGMILLIALALGAILLQIKMVELKRLEGRGDGVSVADAYISTRGRQGSSKGISRLNL